MAVVLPFNAAVVLTFNAFVENRSEQKRSEEVLEFNENMRTPNILFEINLKDNLMGMLWERGICKQDIIGAFQKLCVLQDMKDMLEFMRKRHVNMKILSNGNTVFIKAILEASGIDIFKDEDIICNPSYFNEDEKVVINAYHSHDCSMCPVNLCKGKVMKLILEQNYDRVFYLGDGEGDFCPGTLLKK